MRAGPTRARRRGGFVLLEVIVSLMILGIALSAVMRSFTQSLKAVRLMEVKTQAQFFAMQLIHQFEVDAPFAGKHVGGFGNDYKEYSFKVDVRYVAPKYPHLEGVKDVDRYFPIREMTIEIDYDDGVRPAFVPLTMETAIVGFEKMSPDTKRSYGYF